MQGRRAGSEERAREGHRKTFCEEFPVALHLYWRRSSKKEFIWVSAEWSCAELGRDQDYQGVLPRA